MRIYRVGKTDFYVVDPEYRKDRGDVDVIYGMVVQCTKQSLGNYKVVYKDNLPILQANTKAELDPKIKSAIETFLNKD